MSSLVAKYCVDTSVIIEFHRGLYRRSLFPGIWRDLTSLMDEGVIVAPREVRNELDAGRDDLGAWAKDHKSAFIDPTTADFGLVSRIGDRFKTATAWLNRTPHADPWVIALAANWNISALSAEAWGESEQTPKLPYVCAQFQVRHLGILEFLEAENLTYS